jgi:hypothetical protein
LSAFSDKRQKNEKNIEVPLFYFPSLLGRGLRGGYINNLGEFLNLKINKNEDNLIN